jgi:hypothetical protein
MENDGLGRELGELRLAKKIKSAERPYAAQGMLDKWAQN